MVYSHKEVVLSRNISTGTTRVVESWFGVLLREMRLDRGSSAGRWAQEGVE